MPKKGSSFKKFPLAGVPAERFRQLYWTERRSVREIAELLGAGCIAVRGEMQRKGVPLRNVKLATRMAMARPEVRAKMSAAKMGNKGRTGQKTSEETKAKQRIPKLGKKISEATRQKLRDSHRGKPSPWKGKSRPPVVGAGSAKFLPYTRKDGRELLVQGSWELAVAQHLDSVGEAWEYTARSREHSFAVSGGRRYYPDFYLPRLDLYLDPKAFIRESNAEKYAEVHRLYPGRVRFLLGKTYLSQLKALLNP